MMRTSSSWLPSAARHLALALVWIAAPRCSGETPAGPVCDECPGCKGELRDLVGDTGAEIREGTETPERTEISERTEIRGERTECDDCPAGHVCLADGTCLCVPTCAGKSCGTDGCGGECGFCGNLSECVAGQCVCAPDCDDRQCGPDGCGGQCGVCTKPEACIDGDCSCVPDCDGKMCGPNGCGGTCGECPESFSCKAATCVPNTCQPDCSMQECGPDGCGGVCGACPAGDICTADGECVCIPDCSGKQCGVDGCGGTCAACTGGFLCYEGACVAEPCLPSCLGKECSEDGCGGTCGDCPPQSVCGDGVCFCIPDCAGKQCGQDGCGVECGACDDNEICADGACSCVPKCNGLECGDDGCGAACGVCPGGSTCVAGKCECLPEGAVACCNDGMGVCWVSSCGLAELLLAGCDFGCANAACLDCLPTCVDAECGPDGCGGDCGECGPHEECLKGSCTCVPDCVDKQCGPDGCGDDCGKCGPNDLCVVGGCTCIPKCAGKQCGPDGCGGDCGDCDDGVECLDGTCPCIPQCTGKLCGPDGCEGSCGDCPEGNLCTSEGECVCIPECSGKQCGPDGCGKDCGVCPGDIECVDGKCPSACVPGCTGVFCGPDGCGGSCGECKAPGYCQDGQCYDCSNEGWCNAVTCPTDDNPCTLEVVGPDGKCVSVENQACAEPISSLRQMFRGAQTYYANWIKDSGKFAPPPTPTVQILPLDLGPTPDKGTCCASLGGPDTNGNNACDYSNIEGEFDSKGWLIMSFVPQQEHKYIYKFKEIGDGTVGQVLFEASAIGDLDCDGKPGMFVLKGSFGGGPGDFAADSSDRLNRLGRPSSITYLPEKGGALNVASTWPTPTATEHNTRQYYEAKIEESHAVRYYEAIKNVLLIYDGAKRYYVIPKAELNSPPCQTPDATQAVLSPYEGVVPYTQQPLSQGLTPIEVSCCMGYGPDKDGDDLCDPDPGLFSTLTWNDLGFGIDVSHKFRYGFKQDASEGDAFSFLAEASADIHCTGQLLVVMQTGTVSKDGAGKCVVERWPVVEFGGAGYYGPWAALDMSPKTGYAAKLFLSPKDGSTLDSIAGSFESLFALQLAGLDAVTTGISAAWAKDCVLPAFPPRTPDVDSCCSPSQALCPPDPALWEHPFWKAIGFSISQPHLYTYKVWGVKVTAEIQVLFVESRGNADCYWQSNLIRRVGVAKAPPGGPCTVEWPEGFSVQALFE